MFLKLFRLLVSPNSAALPFAELLKRRADDAAALHYAVSSHPDVGQVAPDDAVIHDDGLNIQLDDMTHKFSKQCLQFSWG